MIALEDRIAAAVAKIRGHDPEGYDALGITIGVDDAITDPGRVADVSAETIRIARVWGDRASDAAIGLLIGSMVRIALDEASNDNGRTSVPMRNVYNAATDLVVEGRMARRVA